MSATNIFKYGWVNGGGAVHSGMMLLDHEGRHCLVVLGDSLTPWAAISPWCREGGHHSEKDALQMLVGHNENRSILC